MSGKGIVTDFIDLLILLVISLMHYVHDGEDEKAFDERL